MIAKLRYIWRLAASGFCFVFFGVATWLASLFLLPLFRLLPGGKTRYKERVQALVSRFFRLFLWSAKTLGLLQITTHHIERLQATGEPFVVVANHPTLIDVILLLSRMPRVDCVVKEGLYHNFFLKGMVKSAGYICNTEDPKALLEACVTNIKAGFSVLIFPEGSRSLPEGLRDFKRGAARVALEAKCRILPVTITCDPPALQKGQKWYDIPPRPSDITLSVGEPIDPQEIAKDCDNAAIAARRVTAYLQRYFAERILRVAEITEGKDISKEVRKYLKHGIEPRMNANKHE